MSLPWRSMAVTFVVALLLCASLSFLIFITFFGPSQYRKENRTQDRPDSTSGDLSLSDHDKSVQVVVLGDIGRSPRMQYHAISLAKCGFCVDLVGFAESEVHPEVKASSPITVVPLALPPKLLQARGPLFIVFGPLKAIWQAFDLYRTLSYRTQAAKFMLVQNPPSIPLLAVALLVCWLRRSRLVIDWHNFGWSVLALKLGRRHPLVLVAKWYENFFSQLADAHFAVTEAMSKYLLRTIGIRAFALHDRPAQLFQPLTEVQRAAFLSRLEQTSQFARDLEKGDWRLVVSSTSWTADEDFSLLLDAIVGYCRRAASGERLPKILAIITGKGPQEQYYMQRIKALNQQNLLSHAIITTAWLSSEDYALLLGAADLGVSLHQSTSGVDLPMKVVDMFGAGLPVVGWGQYESWPELVRENINGRGFGSAGQLEELLVELLEADAKALKKLRIGALKEGDRRWDDEWAEVAQRHVFR